MNNYNTFIIGQYLILLSFCLSYLCILLLLMHRLSKPLWPNPPNAIGVYINACTIHVRTFCAYKYKLYEHCLTFLLNKYGSYVQGYFQAFTYAQNFAIKKYFGNLDAIRYPSFRFLRWLLLLYEYFNKFCYCTSTTVSSTSTSSSSSRTVGGIIAPLLCHCERGCIK